MLDTSAFLALRGDEAGANRVAALLSQAKKINAGSWRLFVWRAEGEEPARHALRLIDSLTVQWTACDNDILESDARLKARGNLSVADSWIAATAIVHGATLLHKNPEFEAFQEIAQEILK